MPTKHATTPLGNGYSKDEEEFLKWVDRFRSRVKRPVTVVEFMALLRFIGWRKVAKQGPLEEFEVLVHPNNRPARSQAALKRIGD